jgi:hypothetical protein
MLRKHTSGAAGYIIVEVIVSTSIVAIISAGIWQTVFATRDLVTRSSHFNEPTCDLPTCTAGDGPIICSCGEQRFVILP